MLQLDSMQLPLNERRLPPTKNLYGRNKRFIRPFDIFPIDKILGKDIEAETFAPQGERDFCEE